ncbi:MAG TPA: glycosyltransferase [Ignavibacteriaceae bacterium]|nr:glycosyltransferase [Ignavibacteriaceae bacterium]
MLNNQKLKILHVISDLRRGGRERQLSIIANNSNSRLENHVIAFHKNDNIYLNEYSFPIISYTRNNKIKRLFDLYNYVKKNKINLIHTWGNNETIYSFFAAKLSGIPLLNGSIRHGIRLNKFSHRFRSFVLKRSKFILGNSYAGFNVNKIKLNNKKHFVVYNGIEDKFFISKNPAAKNKFLCGKKLPENTIVLISVSNFIPFKDLFTPIKVISDLIKHGYQLHYILIGKGPLQKDIEAEIKNLSLENNVSILSNCNIPELLSIADIFIHSSLGEGCSNAILEGMAAGIPILASDVGGTKEITDKMNAILFEYKNFDDLFNKLKYLLDNVEIREKMGQKSKEIVKERFAVNKMIENYTIVVDRILSN